MHISIGNIYSHITASNPSETKALEKLKSKMKCYAPGYRYTYLYKTKKWDGKADLLINDTFLTGMVETVLDHLTKEKIKVTIGDQRGITPGNLRGTGVSLRPYQIDAVKGAFGKTLHGTWWPRGVIKVATGGGKTEIAAAMIEMANVPTLFLVHRKDLLYQSYKRFKKYGLNPGIIGDGKFRVGRVICCTMQTLHSIYKNKTHSLEWLKDIQQVFFDEAHLLAADLQKGNTFVRLASLVPNAYMRWGLTATPFMKDNYSDLLLEGVSGRVVYEISNRELIDKGYLSEGEVTIYEVPQDKNIVNSWPDCYHTGVMLHNGRNQKIIEILKTCPKPALVLVQKVGHGDELSAKAYKQGMDIPFICGTTPAETREEVISGLMDGTLDYVIASTIWDEGVDIPNLRTLIMAGGGKSTIKNLQRLGRSLRISEGKDKALIVDFYDHSTRWLRNHSKQRCDVWCNQGFKIVWKPL